MKQYNEWYNERTGLTVGVRKVLFSEQTPFQKVEVLETDTWGNLMTIDDMVMLSEKDEFVYHEMIVHPALCAHPNPKRVLIIGGGDGGTAREVLKHTSIEHVDMVEIDEAVVRASKLHFPKVGAFNHPKLHVKYEDGISFVKNVVDPYDVIIIDGSDPVGPAEGLFTHAFYESCHRALSEDGILTAQSESPFVEKYHSAIKAVVDANAALFPVALLYLVWIPLYPTGMWSLTFASKSLHPLDKEVLSRVQNRLESQDFQLKYYNESIHKGAFALPTFVQDILK